MHNCVSRANAGNGIQVGSRVQVLNNNCSDSVFAGFSVPATTVPFGFFVIEADKPLSP
jgi:hypothetical protein